jgi:hypothetical protein
MLSIFRSEFGSSSSIPDSVSGASTGISAGSFNTMNLSFSNGVCSVVTAGSTDSSVGFSLRSKETVSSSSISSNCPEFSSSSVSSSKHFLFSRVRIAASAISCGRVVRRTCLHVPLGNFSLFEKRSAAVVLLDFGLPGGAVEVLGLGLPGGVSSASG